MGRCPLSIRNLRVTSCTIVGIIEVERTFKGPRALRPLTLGGDSEPGVLDMSGIPLDLERRCEQRWAASFSAARALQEQHRLEKQQHQQLTAPDNSKSKARRVEFGGLDVLLTGRREPAGA